MTVKKEIIEDLIKEYGKDGNDTGSTKTQIAIFTERINTITSHLQSNKKDHSGRRGLVNLVSKRRRHLNYLRKNDLNSYKNVIKKTTSKHETCFRFASQHCVAISFLGESFRRPVMCTGRSRPGSPAC